MSEEQLVLMLKNHSQRNEAFTLLVRMYQEKIYWHIRRLVILHEDADDVVQNTFLKIFRNIESFKGDSKLYTWMYRIATNESLTFLDKKKKKNVLNTPSSDELTMQQLESDSHFDGNDAVTHLMIAISKLPEKQRLVFQLKYFEEMSYQEMSEILETSEGALKASFHHASQKIKESLKNITYLH